MSVCACVCVCTLRQIMFKNKQVYPYIDQRLVERMKYTAFIVNKFLLDCLPYMFYSYFYIVSVVKINQILYQSNGLKGYY